MAKPAKPKSARRRLSPKEKSRVAEIYDRFAAAVAEPRTELAYKTPFTLLVAVVLSAQATDKSVNKATERLYAVADTPEVIVKLGESGLTPFIASIGLFRTKAKNVVRLSQILVEEYGGQVPLEREKLEALPGVGRKTASVVLNERDIEPAIAVDTHVFRVAHRLKLSTGKTPHDVEDDLMVITPAPYLSRAHHWLILHGRYTCLARKPRCAECLVGDLCPSRDVFL
jgi:endonuclease III